jgi:rSAM/selenodomain-associated transferase 2/rSAM/selenodomain-associated transferase 1
VTFSVIIPVLNEEAIIERCVSGVRELDPDVEIIIADGGSTDDTVRIARQLGALVCLSQAGRGIQCNAGAASATGDVLVFLHADTHLPDNAFPKLKEIFSDPRVHCGTFRISFDHRHWFLSLMSFLSLLDPGFFRFGDQCLVIRRSCFTSLGGFRDWRLFEDIDLVRRARKGTRVRRFPMSVTTSSRRFLQNGVIRQAIKNAWYTARYSLGTSPDRLALEYEQQDDYLKAAFLAVFVRYPRPGFVKTRLGAVLGDCNAARFYRECAGQLIAETSKLPGSVRRQVWYAGATREEMERWLGREVPCLAQPEGDLGARLTFALDRSFRQGARKVIVLASDVPDLSVGLIRRAFRVLDTSDMVIGPTHDGGYYLIGLTRPCPELFQNIGWSTSSAFQHTMDAANRLGLLFQCLPKLHDIDTIEDLMAWRGHPDQRSLIGRLAGVSQSEDK